jgi:two-component system LytT family sensor kinase
VVFLKSMPSRSLAKKNYLNDGLQVPNGYISVVKLKRIFVYHLAAWVIFAAYEVSTIYFVTGQMMPAADYTFHYLLNALLFYIHVALVTGKLRRRLIVFVAVAEVVCYIMVNYGLNTLLEHFLPFITRPTSPLRAFAIASLYRCLYFIGIATLYAIAVNLLRSKEQLSAMERAAWTSERQQAEMQRGLLKAQNAVLRAQINPHLFFNTLNFIYTSVHKLSARAGEAVMLLSDLTRYSITGVDAEGQTYLSDEISGVRDLLQLNQIRFNDRLQVRFECDFDGGEMKIIPLVLMTLVENVLKYGDLQDPGQPAVIRLQLLDDRLHFATRNKKLPAGTTVKGMGMGLSNTRMRLQQAYHDHFSFRINETEDAYFTDLTIQGDMLCLVAIS